MLRFGMPTLIETDTIEECAALCRELGLEFIEMNMNLPQYQVQTMDAERLKKVAKEYGISYTIHLDENMNVADFNPLVAGAYTRTVVDAIELAKKLEIPVLNMHFIYGVYFTLPHKKVFLFEQYRDEYMKNMCAFRDACEKAIGDSGIRICMENSKTYFDFQKDALELLLESPVFALTLDVGHNHCSGYADEGWIRDREIRHMHLHDARGSKQDHQPLGQGEMDIPAYLELAKERGCTVLLEVKTLEGLRQSVAWLRETGRW